LLGAPGLRTHKEVFTKIDNENYIKEATVIEGGFLDLGFKRTLRTKGVTREPALSTDTRKLRLNFSVLDTGYFTRFLRPPLVPVGKILSHPKIFNFRM
jgi:hypothetical protein